MTIESLHEISDLFCYIEKIGIVETYLQEGVASHSTKCSLCKIVFIMQRHCVNLKSLDSRVIKDRDNYERDISIFILVHIL